MHGTLEDEVFFCPKEISLRAQDKGINDLRHMQTLDMTVAHARKPWWKLVMMKQVIYLRAMLCTSERKKSEQTY